MRKCAQHLIAFSLLPFIVIGVVVASMQTGYVAGRKMATDLIQDVMDD